MSKIQTSFRHVKTHISKMVTPFRHINRSLWVPIANGSLTHNIAECGHQKIYTLLNFEFLLLT